MRPKVTVIVPVYNMEKYLNECLDSLINQTLKDIEIICFNDASKDSSLSILKEYASRDERVKIIDSKVNIKQGGGRNEGIRQSSADYLLFVDADDKADPNLVEKLYNTMIETKADIVVSELYNWRPSEGFASRPAIEAGAHTYLTKQQAVSRGGYTIGILYRKSLFIKHDLFFPENMFYEDTAIAAPLYLVAGKIVLVEQQLYYYRKHIGSTTNIKNDPRFFDRLETAKIALNHIKRLGKYDAYRECVNDMFFTMYYKTPIPGIFSYFKPIPYDKIKYIKESVYEYLSKDDVDKFIAQGSLRERLALTLLKASPRLSAISWQFTGWLLNHVRY